MKETTTIRVAALTGACLLCGLAMPLAAQESEPEPAREPAQVEPAAPDKIIVTGARRRGELDVEQAPLLELGEEDIAAEGVASIADLIAQIEARSGSARGRGGGGRPVILINGIRVGSFREFSNYPPEALERVEVFPEETALRFGFPPDRRVINLILKENYRNAEVELEFEGPARGGYAQREQEVGFLQIANGGRINLNLTASDFSLLTEAERDIVQPEGSISDVTGDPSQAPFRSLIADGRTLEADASWAKAIVDSGISLSANASYDRSDSLALQGLNTVILRDGAGDDATSVVRTFGEATPLEQRIASDTFAASGSLTKPVNAMRLTTTFDVSLAETTQEVDRPFDTSALEAQALAGEIALDAPLPTEASAGFDTAFTRVIAGETLTTLRGPIAFLPGGELTATFDAGLNWQRIESEDTRTQGANQLTRRVLTTGANLSIPITSRRNGFADALGSFTLIANIGLDDLSDFGTLGDYTLGINWQPFANLDLSATYIEREVAPGLAQLGDPQIALPAVPVFDFTTGETVLATVITGGNPDLLAETQADWKFAANWELPFWDNSRLTIEYVRNRSDDVTRAFPQVTPEIEAAFPGRITRGADGRLVAIDRRFVTFAETRAERVQLSLFTTGSFADGEPDGEGERRERSAPTARPDPSARGPDGEGAPRLAPLRAIACAEDGIDRLRALIARIDAGEDVSDELPGFDPAIASAILARLRGEDGTIPDERLEALRTRICENGSGEGGAGGNNARSGPPGGGFNPLARNRFRGFRYFASLNHTIELENEILIAPGLDPLDQLDGEATGAFGFPRHTSRLEAGVFGQGIGVRLSGRYTGETRLDGSGLPGSRDLFFDDIATFDIRVFGEVGRLLEREDEWLDNLRVSLRMDNVFDAQRRVVDADGVTPLNYQPFLIDPLGRFIGIDIRKLF